MRHVLASVLVAAAAMPLGGCPLATRPPERTIDLTGTVTAAHSGRPLARADVRVGATEHRAQTDDAGRFTVSGVPASADADTLLVMAYGYRWGRAPIAGQRSFSVALDSSITTLEQYLEEHQRGVGGELNPPE